MNKHKEQFINDIENIIEEWYNNCPKSMKFVSNVIAAYKKFKKQENKKDE